MTDLIDVLVGMCLSVCIVIHPIYLFSILVVAANVNEMSHCIRKQSEYAKTKMQMSCAVTAQLISAFVFAP